MSKVLVFDFGASSARAIIVETDGESLKTEEIHRFPNNPITVDDTLYWDIDTLLDEVKAAVQKAASRGKVDVFISVDSLGAEETVVKVNEPLLKGYIEALQHIYEHFSQVPLVSFLLIQHLLWLLLHFLIFLIVLLLLWL